MSLVTSSSMPNYPCQCTSSSLQHLNQHLGIRNHSLKIFLRVKTAKMTLCQSTQSKTFSKYCTQEMQKNCFLQYTNYIDKGCCNGQNGLNHWLNSGKEKSILKIESKDASLTSDWGICPSLQELLVEESSQRSSSVYLTLILSLCWLLRESTKLEKPQSYGCICKTTSSSFSPPILQLHSC